MFPHELAARSQDRVKQRIDSSVPVAVRGNVHPLARAEHDRGRVSPTKVLPRMVMMFNRTAEQQADLEKLLQEQQEPSSSNYHQWLTPEQFADRFGVSANDVAKVTDWLESRGFTIVETPPSRAYVAFRGTVGQVDSVFRTEVHHYKVSGEEHFANASDPMLPGALANIVTGFWGLDDFRPRPHASSVRPKFTSYISGRHFLAPDDFATIYNVQPLYNAGIDGTGQSVVVIGQSNIDLADVRTFRTVSGLPANDPQKVLVGSDPGIRAGDVDEAALDLEWAGAVARGATVIYVYATNAFNALTYAVNNNLGGVLSSSYGSCESSFPSGQLTTLSNTAQQANAQGMTIVAASGDSGAADCDFNVAAATQGLQVDILAGLPNVTGVGGTSSDDSGGTYWTTNNVFQGSALSYIPEVAWNDTATSTHLSATGGGAAVNFTKPSWQKGAGVPNDGRRDVPDVSLFGSPGLPGYLICSQGWCVNGFRNATDNLDVIGGTSAGAPAFAGIVALLNQATGSLQGNMNPRLYELAALSTEVFHDITSGDNKVPCTSPSTDCPVGTTMIGYSAAVGYDQATGLGSVNAFNLLMQWVPVAITPNPIRFGNRLPNIAKTIPVTIRNNNGPTLNISGISISGNYTLTSNNCPSTLSFGASCTVSVTFVPTSGSTDNGTLTVTADDSGSPHEVAISGTGADLAMQIARPGRLVRSEANPAPAAGSAQPVAPAQVSASASSVTGQVVTAATAVVPSVLVSPLRWTPEGRGTITITNRHMTAVTIEVSAAGDITQEGGCGPELDGGASCDIQVSRATSGSKGELRIATPSGSTRVRVGAEERAAQ